MNDSSGPAVYVLNLYVSIMKLIRRRSRSRTKPFGMNSVSMSPLCGVWAGAINTLHSTASLFMSILLILHSHLFRIERNNPHDPANAWTEACKCCKEKGRRKGRRKGRQTSPGRSRNSPVVPPSPISNTSLAYVHTTRHW